MRTFRILKGLKPESCPRVQFGKCARFCGSDFKCPGKQKCVIKKIYYLEKFNKSY
jgi:hypothetical protein